MKAEKKFIEEKQKKILNTEYITCPKCGFTIEKIKNDKRYEKL